MMSNIVKLCQVSSNFIIYHLSLRRMMRMCCIRPQLRLGSGPEPTLAADGPVQGIVGTALPRARAP